MRNREQLMKVLPWISTPILLLIFLGGWQLTVSAGAVSRFTLPSPASVWHCLGQLLQQSSTYHDLWITLWEVLIGFAIALVAGIVIGAVLGRVRWLERAVRSPPMVAFQVIPKVAFVPDLRHLVRLRDHVEDHHGRDPGLLPHHAERDAGRPVGRRRPPGRDAGSRRDQVGHLQDLELPSTLPYIFAGAEVGIVFAVIGAIVGEYLGGSEGLGHQVVTSLNSLDAPSLFAVIVLLAVMGSLLYLRVTLAKRLVIPWHDSVARQ